MKHSNPEIFISATSKDLRTSRHVIKEALLRLGCIPVEQTIFLPETGKVRKMLRKKILRCRAVIHVVGEVYGTEPKERSKEEIRRSYTQMEYDIGLELNMPIYILSAEKAFLMTITTLKMKN